MSTSIDSVSGGVKVNWVTPSINGNGVLTSFNIEIQTASINGPWSVAGTYCDGTLATVIASTSCVIPMSVFWSDPFNLT